MMSDSFEGFSNATIKFLKELKNNNNRDWFNENKHRYESDLLGDSLSFIEAMQPILKKVSPYFQAIPKRTGGSLMRIYRDTRFAKNKTPYKTNIGIHFRHEMGRDVHAPGFYLHIEPTESFFGAGIWRPESKALAKIRNQLVEQPQRWKRIANGKKMAQHFEFSGEKLKRPPRDFDKDHPLIEDLKRKDFFVLAEINTKEIKTRKLLPMIESRMRETKLLMTFLCDSLRIPC